MLPGAKGGAEGASLSRRRFLQGGGALALSLCQLSLFGGCGGREEAKPAPTPLPGAPTPAAAGGPALPDYRTWEDLYRRQWVWDAVHRGTHFVNCWYQRGCNWNVFVKDGLVFREEQAANYEMVKPGVPDFNPRGCQKGACYSHRMYDAGRLRYPLKRAGARGEGKWTRISWEQALREIADKTIDVLREDGPGAITFDPGTANTNGCYGLGTFRTGTVLDTPIIDVNCEVGDHHPGALVTLGKISSANSGDDLIYSDLILIWGGNPTYTQIPNAHFINEARYHGARVVCITPDYNASAIHADRWLPINPGTDAALGLALAQVMVEENLYDARFVAEQTDLPLLVRSDTHRLLRQSDMEANGADDIFYVFDKKSGKIRTAEQGTLELGAVEPALETEQTVTTRGGPVRVTTAFSRLRKQLADYTPEAAFRTTGTHPDLVRTLAREIAKARAATLITQSSFSKHYHGVEMERAQFLVFALAGQMGKKGSGVNAFPAMSAAGLTMAVVSSGSRSPKQGALLLSAQAAPKFIELKWKGFTDEMIVYEMVRDEFRKGGHIPGALFLYYHGGLDSLYGSSAQWDPAMKRSLKSFLSEAVNRGWQFEPPKTRQRIFFEVGGNILRRSRGYDRLYETFLPKLDLFVTVDWRMSNTALHSDYVLPAAGWYEKDDITWATPIAPFAHVTTRAVAPLAESKTDWEFHCLLLKTVQERAVERGVLTFKDRAGQERRLDTVYDELTFGRRYTENNAEELLNELLECTTNLNDVRWPEIKEKGFERYTGVGMDYVSIGNATDFVPGETITASTWHTEKKMPWPTLTRRIQFYIDHPFYLELGETLPVHKDPPPMGGNYPLSMVGQHARWSIHASWRDSTPLLRLQRGEPVVIVSPVDAESRGLHEGDRVRVRNDIGHFEALLKISPTARPGTLIINHAWEPFQFKGGRSHQSLIPSPMNPIQLAGGHFHLQPSILMGSAGGVDRGTRVEIEALKA